MKFNRTRHKALVVLSEKFNSILDKKKSGSLGGDGAGLTNEELNKILKIDDRTRRLVFSELFENEEVLPFHINNSSGCFIHSEKGLESIASEKYLEKNREIIKNWLRDFSQIAIPLLALLVSVLVIINDDSKRDKEIQSIEQKLEELQRSKESKELMNKTRSKNQINDTLSIDVKK